MVGWKSLVFSDTTLGRRGSSYTMLVWFRIQSIATLVDAVDCSIQVRLPVMQLYMLYYLGLNPTLTASWNWILILQYMYLFTIEESYMIWILHQIILNFSVNKHDLILHFKKVLSGRSWWFTRPLLLLYFKISTSTTDYFSIKYAPYKT